MAPAHDLVVRSVSAGAALHARPRSKMASEACARRRVRKLGAAPIVSESIAERIERSHAYDRHPIRCQYGAHLHGRRACDGVGELRSADRDPRASRETARRVFCSSACSLIRAAWLWRCLTCVNMHHDACGSSLEPAVRAHAGQRHCWGVKKQLGFVLEDDRFFRGSIERVMPSLAYTVETFPSAAEFLASPRLNETACLIADVHIPGMTGIELNRPLIGAGYAIPTILVTAYPNDIDQDRALNDGIICYLRKPVDE